MPIKKTQIPLYFWVLGDLLIFLLLAFYLFTNSFWVHTYITNNFSDFIAEKYQIETRAKSLGFAGFRTLEIQELYMEDPWKDTLVYAEKLKIKIDVLSLLFQRKIAFKAIDIEGLKFYLQNSEQEKLLNLQILLNKISPSTTTEKKSAGSGLNFEIYIESFKLKNSRFRFKNFWEPRVENPINMDYFDLDIAIEEIFLKETSLNPKQLKSDIQNIAAQDKSGFVLAHLSSPFVMEENYFELPKATLLSSQTYYHGKIRFDYSNGFKDFLDFVNQVRMDYEILDAYAFGADIAHFAPVLNGLGEYVPIYGGKVFGTVNDLRGENLQLGLKNSTFLTGDFRIQKVVSKENPIYYFEIDSLHSTLEDLRNLSLYPYWDNRLLEDFLPFLSNNLTFSAKAWAYYDQKKWRFKAETQGIFGQIKAQLHQKENQADAWEGNIEAFLKNGQEFGISQLKQLQLYGNFEVSSQTSFFQAQLQKIIVAKEIIFEKGKIKIEEKNKNIFLNFEIEDKNNGFISIQNKQIEDQHQLQIQTQKLNLSFLDETKDILLDSKGKIDFSFQNLKNLQLKSQISLLQIQKNNKNFILGPLEVEIKSQNNKNTLFSLQSPAIQTLIEGVFELEKMPFYIEQSLEEFFPNQKNNFYSKDFFDFNIHFEQIDPWLKILNWPIFIAENSFIKGEFNPKNQKFNLDLETDDLVLNTYTFKKTKIQWEKKGVLNGFRLRLKHFAFENLQIQNIHWVLQSSESNQWQGFFNWFNDLEQRGNLNLSTQWSDDWKKIKTSFKNSDFLVDGKAWELHPEAAFVRMGDRFGLENIIFEHEKEKLSISGDILGEKPLQVLIKNIHLGEYQKLLKEWTGKNIEGVFNAFLSIKWRDFFRKDHWLKGDLLFNDFEINGQKIGQLELKTDWIQGKKAFVLGGSIEQNKNQKIGLKGNYFLANENLQLSLQFQKLQLGFFGVFFPKEFGILDFNALASGQLQLEGKINQPQLKGQISISEGSFGLKYTGLDYDFQGNLFIDKQKIKFQEVFAQVKNSKNKISLQGFIDINDLENLAIEQKIRSNHFLFLKTSSKDNPYYFGNIYASTDLELSYKNKQLILKGKIDIDDNSKFSLYLLDAYQEKRNNLVKFTSKNNINVQEENKKNNNDYEAEIQINIASGTKVEIGFDQKNTQLIKAKISGQALLKYQNETPLLFGEVAILEGEYNLSLQSIINKKFYLSAGGQMRWNGPLSEGNLSIKANLPVRASIGTLNPPQEIGENNTAQTSSQEDTYYNFLCIVQLQDQIVNPSFNYQVQLEDNNVSEEVNAQLRKILGTPVETMAQFASLLITGQFLPKNISNLANNLYGSGINTSIGFLTNSISNVISSFLGERVDLKLKYNRTTSGEQQVQVGIEAPLIKDRLMFRGSTGVSQRKDVTSLSQDIANKDISNLIGDFDLEYKINKEGNLKIKVFNQINDINSISSTDNQQRYTQGLGVQYQDDFDGFFKDSKLAQTVKNWFKKKKKKKKQNPETILDTLENNTNQDENR